MENTKDKRISCDYTTELTDSGLEAYENISKERIKKQYKDALELYSERFKYVGPDCGVIGLHNHEVVSVLYKRTVDAIKEIRNS